MNWGQLAAGVALMAGGGFAWLLRRIDRHADKAIAGHIDAALANSAASDGSHDSLVLDRCEEFAWREIEREYDRSTP